ncbi:hypothetical protein QBC37DRAFT_393226 [Rhypophila decipiens]|uniref:Uncharacterized protein n=1 Tax=Rhypophila decipiens TaxID=261697 RepID=A0AAN7B1V3_9PEZI|nr:hypothetical protein QBC37DRAFT_393226 [Rhypophila decipiens]
MCSTNRYEASPGTEGWNSRYFQYKALEKSIFGLLDPKQLLPTIKLPQAKQIANNLIQQLPHTHHDTVLDNLTQAIKLRSQVAKRYKDLLKAKYNPHLKRDNHGHALYIQFLEGIKQALMEWKSAQEEAVPGPEAQQPEPEEERDLLDDGDGTGAGLTLQQADFNGFLQLVLTLAGDAAALWEGVERGELPFWLASMLTDIKFREIISMINEARLLWEEDQPRSEGKKKGKKSKKTKEGAKQSLTLWVGTPPQLTQDWVAAMNKVSGAGTIWSELTALLPSIPRFINALVVPMIETAPLLHSSLYTPLLFGMLEGAIPALAALECLTSLAQVPFEAVVATYFCNLINDDGTEPDSTKTLTQAASAAVLNELNEGLALVPWLREYGGLMDNQEKLFRELTWDMKSWAKTCFEPLTLGPIYVYARAQRVDFEKVFSTGSLPLQVFLYLYELRRLKAPELATGDDGREYERLVGALLQDPRVAPLLLRNGRPQSVEECAQALRAWCIPQPEKKGLGPLESRRKFVMQRIADARRSNGLSKELVKNGYCITATVRSDLAKYATMERKHGPADDTALLGCALAWEMGFPNCSKLEAVLLDVVQNTPGGGSGPIADVVRHGFHTVGNQGGLPKPAGAFISESVESLEVVVLEAVLGVPQGNESLKAALANVAQIQYDAESAQVGAFVNVTMPLYLKLADTFKVKAHSNSIKVRGIACVCHLSSLFESQTEETWCKDVEQILQTFMEGARPVLEKTYGGRDGTAEDRRKRNEEFEVE